MPYRLRVLEEWNNFRLQVVPVSYPPEQVLQLRGAFYAGLTSALTIIHKETTLTGMQNMLMELAMEINLYRGEVHRRTHGETI